MCICRRILAMHCHEHTNVHTTCEPEQGRACTAGMTDGKRRCNVRANEEMVEGVGIQVLGSGGRQAGRTGGQVGNAGTVDENRVK